MATLRSTARSYFDGTASPAHDWHHVQRVEALADRLLSAYPDADERTLRAAVLLHDIGRSREDRGEIDDHARWGAREARDLLAGHALADRTEDICHAIRVHRYSNDRRPETIEAKLLCDADNLDALGAVGIARCFTYGGERGGVIYDPDNPPGEDERPDGSTQYNHLHKKILDLPDRMYTEAGREIAADRREFVDSFIARFDAEVSGRR
ncbi:HD domain-containing protein [Halovenus sp. WSH3]|uniref:HD domain-containing protein n=2 Tax=Halovenus carboxidivorans TaxID=2692199 RepID=A0A6B0T6X8_9EURY|nr:HD domain-containing protein [Halovenus carboxidivorans]